MSQINPNIAASTTALLDHLAELQAGVTIERKAEIRRTAIACEALMLSSPWREPGCPDYEAWMALDQAVGQVLIATNDIDHIAMRPHGWDGVA